MKFTVASIIGFTALAVASPRPIIETPVSSDVEVMPKSIPECARQCLADAIHKKTTCQVDDIPCVCNSMTAVASEATGCVLKKCGLGKAMNEVKPAAEALCQKK